MHTYDVLFSYYANVLNHSCKFADIFLNLNFTFTKLYHVNAFFCWLCIRIEPAVIYFFFKSQFAEQFVIECLYVCFNFMIRLILEPLMLYFFPSRYRHRSLSKFLHISMCAFFFKEKMCLKHFQSKEFVIQIVAILYF